MVEGGPTLHELESYGGSGARGVQRSPAMCDEEDQDWDFDAQLAEEEWEAEAERVNSMQQAPRLDGPPSTPPQEVRSLSLPIAESASQQVLS